mgnify:CR=1 FL=1
MKIEPGKVRHWFVGVELAEKFGIRDYPNPAGGCLLTDPGFAKRVKDLLKYNSLDIDGKVDLAKFIKKQSKEILKVNFGPSFSVLIDIGFTVIILTNQDTETEINQSQLAFRSYKIRQVVGF